MQKIAMSNESGKLKPNPKSGLGTVGSQVACHSRSVLRQQATPVYNVAFEGETSLFLSSSHTSPLVMAPTLADLPDEILSSILANFCLHCTRAHNYDAPDGYFRTSDGERGQHQDNSSWNFRDFSGILYSMCLVSQRFLSVAQPFLHHTFLLGYGDSWQSSAFSWNQRLSSFLRTIVRRPDLAVSARRIYVHPQLLYHVHPHEARRALDDTAHILDTNLDVAGYTAHFQKLLTEAGGLQTDALALLGMVLALVPNLDRFSLQVPGPTGGIPALAFQTLARATPPAETPLSNLKTLDVCCHSEGSTLFDLDHHAGGILEAAHRSLETLNLHMCGTARLRIGQDRLHLRHLHVTQSRLNDTDFGLLLSACAPGLETLVYEASYTPLDYGSCVSVMPAINADTRQPTDPLLRHLVKFRTTLKTLRFDLRSRPASALLWQGGCTKPLSGTETLTNFKALERVFISALTLCDPGDSVKSDAELLTRLLPCSLRTLELAGERLGTATMRLASALSQLAKNAAQSQVSRFGALERVRCDASMAQAIDGTAIPDLFTTAGIVFGYESWPQSEPTVPRGRLLEWCRSWQSSTVFPSVPMPLPPEDESDCDL